MENTYGKLRQRQGCQLGQLCPCRSSLTESEPVPPKVKNERARYECEEPQVNLSLPRQIGKNVLLTASKTNEKTIQNPMLRIIRPKSIVDYSMVARNDKRAY